MNGPKENFRPDLYIVSRIIKTLVEEGPQKKSTLSLKTGVSYDNLMKYSEWMISKNLISENDGLVHVTQEGIKTYNDLVEWVITYVGKLKFKRNLK